MRYPIPTKCKQHSMFMHRAFFVHFCVGLAAWTRQTDAKLSGTIGVWCGETLPARIKCSSQIADKMRCKLQASTTEVLVESPVRSDHVKALYCTVQVLTRKSGAITFATPPPLCPAARTREEGYPSPHFQFLLLFPSKIHINCFPFPFCPRLSHLLKTQRRNQHVLLRPQQPIFLLACPKGHSCRLISA
jgi:hypothetical protein